MNPHSDIDIMFLCRDEEDRKRSPDLLYRLWDAGLDIGYSARTVRECVSLARQDIKIRTSLMESRLIAGATEVYADFLHAMQGDVLYWRPSAFITEKLAERSITRHKYGGSIYLREPNVKESEGGLRDLHTALWIARVHFRISSYAELVANGVLTEGQFTALQRSRSFLWRLRNEMHYISGRKNDQLTFDLQESAARDFKFRDSAHLLAVERFMKSYFIHARNIRELSSIVVDAVLPKPRRWFDRTRSIGPFKMVGRTLVPASESLCKQHPELIMSAFETAQSHHAAFSEGMKSHIRWCRIDDGMRSSAEASGAFLAILNNFDNLFETLVMMKDLRLLGRYIPEFRAIQSLARHDHYHKYTVDEHILLAIRNLQQLWNGTYSTPATLRDALQGLPKRWLLVLTVLLHDLGKAFRSEHETRGVELADAILDRLQIKGKDRERILFLIRNHLVMANLSQRRELTDRKVIADFSRLVGDRESLALLYLLTFADISAVNPEAWTQWKASLLQDLYVRTLRYLDASEPDLEEEQARITAASNRIRAAAQGVFTSGEVESFLACMPDQYKLTTSAHKVVDHIGMMMRLPEERLVIQHRHYPDKGHSELTVCAFDAYGMFYRTAGTIASQNLNILRARVFTSRNGVMIDTFQITDPAGGICEYEETWKAVHVKLRTTLESGGRPPEPGRYAATPSLPGTVTPSVEFDNEISDVFTIIDITGRDRVGFLYDVARVLYDLNLDIGSAKIVTEGSRVMDSFYISDLFRQKLTDPARLEKIRDALLKVIG